MVTVMKRFLIAIAFAILSLPLAAQDTPPADDIEFMGLSMKNETASDFELRLMNKGFKMLTDNRDSVRLFEGLLDGDTVLVHIQVNPYSIYYADALYFACQARLITIIYAPGDSLKALDWYNRYKAAFDKKYASYQSASEGDATAYMNPRGYIGLTVVGEKHDIASITYGYYHKKPEPDRLGLKDL